MTKKQFITQELRDNTGKFSKVSDIVMENLNIERMGTCKACGHEIDTHVAVYHSSTGYMYVGKDCAKILTKDNQNIIVPDNGTEYTVNGKNQIVVSEDFVRSIGNKIYRTEVTTNKFGEKWTPSLENNYSGAFYTGLHNMFTSNIFLAVVESKKYDGFYHLSVKQYEAIKKALGL
jgi:hypothetical protein